MTSWISLYPQWYISERNAIVRSYPEFRLDEGSLQDGLLLYYGELVVRPSAGAQRYPVRVVYPPASPFELPTVTPVQAVPADTSDGAVKEHPEAVFFNRRHQMPGGGLCLFQRETRGSDGGVCVPITDVLRRAEEWLLGYHTGRWPPESRESELESHFRYAGDILLSQTFYSHDLTGSGRFYMVRDMRRILDAVQQEDPPLIVTVITRHGGAVEAVFDARDDLKNIFSWLGNDAWRPEQLAAQEERAKDEYLQLVTEQGYWWSLPQEPLPFQAGAGLLDVLDTVAPSGDAWTMMSTALGAELAMRSRHFFGLKYPRRTGGFEWLILVVVTKPKAAKGGGILLASSDQEKRQDFERGHVACYKVHGARTEEISLRNTSVVAHAVRAKTVALIGLGALGSKVAELLAQAGVETFRLCDMDRLRTGNVARHIGGLSDFGAMKSRIVMSRLFDINPRLQITKIWNDSAVSSLDGLSEFLKPADITVCTTADENVESAINQIAVLTQKPVVYGRAMRRGSMGRVFLVRPGKDPCKACLGHYAGQARAFRGHPDWFEVTERDDDVLLHECGRPVIPASAIDLSFVASLIARVSLQYLEGGSSETNHWVWSRDPALDVDARFDKHFVTVAASMPRHDACPACQVPDVVGAIVPEAIRTEIIAQVEAAATVETGGILLGFINNERKAVVVRASGPGPNATKTAARFDRDVDFVQAELERTAVEFGTQGLYIGEWHSHLENDPQPSGRDIMSMCGIAESPNYATQCPIMVIAGLDTATGKVVTMKAWSFPASGRMYPIACEDVPCSASIDRGSGD